MIVTEDVRAMADVVVVLGLPSIVVLLGYIQHELVRIRRLLERGL